MDISNILAREPRPAMQQFEVPGLSQQDSSHGHHYPTRRSIPPGMLAESQPFPAPEAKRSQIREPAESRLSPAGAKSKTVTFELHFDGTSDMRGRLPMRVGIWPHDNTKSIVTTVKNFYGLYDAQGVSFEDMEGRTLIASYDNFVNDMVVYVRVNPNYSPNPEYHGQWNYHATSPQPIAGAEEFPPVLSQTAQILSYGQPPSRPGSRISRKQSASPKSSQGRTGSFQKGRSRSSAKATGSSFQAGLDELNSDTQNGYSSSDGGAGSVTGSRKARSEQLVTAEISVDNIVEGGRRKRAKFESSELPLFVPTQVPAPNSVSSTSPQRRSNPGEVLSPFARPAQRVFTYSIPIQSPQGYPLTEKSPNPPPAFTPFTVPAVPNHGHRLRDRSSGATLSNRSSLGSGMRPGATSVLPTPDPTIASCISDEDVALQLMRLGDASNYSHGRTSTSTMDDALSGRADIASSASSTSEEDSDDTEEPSLKIEQDEEQGPASKKQRRYLSGSAHSVVGGEAAHDETNGGFGYFVDVTGANGLQGSKLKSKVLKAKKPRSTSGKIAKPLKLVQPNKKVKPNTFPTASNVQQPLSPASLPPLSRKSSQASNVNFQQQPGTDEEDLSSKPRCQRCRRSKKGCDRQRPCQRCKDAGIGIEGCISEDEGNGRKGRYGRHMGISVKRSTEALGAGGGVVAENYPDSPKKPPTPGPANSAIESKKRKR